MTESEPTLVVDFGTTTSTASLLVDGSVRMLKEPGTGAWTWPSAVCLAGRTLLVGTPAERSKRAYPGAYRSEFKRDLGDGGRIPLGDKSFTPQDLVVEVLRAFTPLAERAAGRPIRHLVLTVPGSYAAHDPRRDLMIEAGERAGFSDVEVLAEPVAAALAPMEGPPLPPDSVVLVYDFGGGTFDAAAVRLSTGVGTVLGHGTREDCGGRDVDAVLGRLIVEQSGPQLAALLARAGDAGDSPQRLAARRARLGFADLVREIKHQLSDAPVASDFFLPADLPIEVDGGDLTARIAPILQETVDCCAEVLASGGLEVDDVTAILLVGGSTRMPVVVDTLRRAFDVPVRHAEDPGTAVAHGAAVWSSSRTDRVVAPSPADAHHIPLRWDVPGGTGTVIRWLVEPGAVLTRDQPVLILRTADGLLTRLTCGATTGRLADQHADAGDAVVAGRWLATVRVGGAEPPAAAAEPEPPGTQKPNAPGRLRSPSTTDILDHPAAVAGLSFDSTGQRLYAGGADGVLRIWDVASQGIPQAVRTSGAITLLVLWRDGRVVLGHRSGDLEAVDTATGLQVWTLSHAYGLVGLAVDRNRGRIAVSSMGVTIMRNVETGRELLEGPPLQGFRSVAFTPDGVRAAAGTGHGQLQLLHASNMTERRTVPLVEGHAVNCLAFGPDGSWVVAGLANGGVALRSAIDGTDLGGYNLRGAVTSVATARQNGSHIVAAGAGASVRIWAVGRANQPLAAFDGRTTVDVVALSPDGTLLAFGDAEGLRVVRL